MHELWIQTNKVSPFQFLGYCFNGRVLADVWYFFCDHQYTAFILRTAFPEARILTAMPVGGKLKYREGTDCIFISNPVFARSDHIDPRDCQAIPIGPLDLITLQKGKPELIRRVAVLPRGEFEKDCSIVEEASGDKID